MVSADLQSEDKDKQDTVTGGPQRHYEIDWLRLLAVFLLFFFHTARIFDPWEEFYVHNNPVSHLVFDIFARPLNPWHMSLFFFLAGASTYFALRHRSGRSYVRERFKRLFIPFLFGVLVLIPPQSYLGLVSHSDSSESFISWFPDFFIPQSDDMDGYYLGGHTWGHLWFIFHLFIYSLVAVSLFLYLKGDSGRRLVSSLARAFTRPGVLYVLPVLLVLMDEFPEVAGGNPLFYITFFVFGFLLMSDRRFGETIDRQRLFLLVMGPLIFAGILIIDTTSSWLANLPEWADTIVDSYVDGFVPWFVILTMLAYGRRYLNFTNRFLKYFAEGAYPLYILHQTIIVVAGYFLVQWDVSIAVKFTLIVSGSFAVSVLAYDVVVRRAKITRFLFGMRPLVRQEKH